MSARLMPRRTSRTGWVVILTGVGSLMAALDTLVVATALSRIRLIVEAGDLLNVRNRG